MGMLLHRKKQEVKELASVEPEVKEVKANVTTSKAKAKTTKRNKR